MKNIKVDFGFWAIKSKMKNCEFVFEINLIIIKSKSENYCLRCCLV